MATSPPSGAPLRQGALSHALEHSGFVWLTGIEDTFITANHPVTGRSLDEYELTGHYRAWASDLELMAELGVSAVRYGIPWHRINPAPQTWDFTWMDEPLGRLLELGIEPVVDLVHYGVPAWIEDAFLHPDYPQLVAEYAARVAERLRGRVQSFTPLNEPRITAWYTGKLGFWPPYQRGWSGFLRVLVAVCRGIIETERQLRAAIPELLSVHVDAADLYTAAEPELEQEAAHRQWIGFLALDLVSGRVDGAHPLRRWVEQHGVAARELDVFLERPARPDVIGLNLYPLFSKKVLKRNAGRLRISMPYAEASLVEALCSLYHERYRCPLLISETATEGSVARRAAWLGSSVAAVGNSRKSGIPVLGYTWWPMFALIAWAYRQGKKPPQAYLKQMGLWDLAANQEGELTRIPTSLVDAYRGYTGGGLATVGKVGRLTPVAAGH